MACWEQPASRPPLPAHQSSRTGTRPAAMLPHGDLGSACGAEARRVNGSAHGWLEMPSACSALYMMLWKVPADQGGWQGWQRCIALEAQRGPARNGFLGQDIAGKGAYIGTRRPRWELCQDQRCGVLEPRAGWGTTSGVSLAGRLLRMPTCTLWEGTRPRCGKTARGLTRCYARRWRKPPATATLTHFLASSLLSTAVFLDCHHTPLDSSLGGALRLSLSAFNTWPAC